ncbi:hypothetical protein BO83DRAFT_394374 [Aspergillus eucalypticola CBS 122712]|uniref:Uncharacterized protein n=1 Tax=Aspergillus eucalypticola (strain CBS 122712 / IBT 29274) TaxID=1448314 RepID=A0A317UN23_ASPEC|nr:uncharacterized protein BO83DRAFT_394374 [Aspergillus eucalypticola CBS 122712]PWY61967.1 hypothetical protein BO83DRAFT_394374 [Aspergillus eucalypticola CBS 122712]
MGYGDARYLSLSLFAKWWSTQIPEHPRDRHEINIRRAINARRIMSNDLSWLSADTPGTFLPELIWYPNTLDMTIYERLAHMRPDMFEECYTHTWDDLLRTAPELCREQFAHDFSKADSNLKNPKLWWLTKHASHALRIEAAASPNNHFQNCISESVPNAGDKLGHWHNPPTIFFHDPVRPGACECPYNGMDCGLGEGMDLCLFLGDALSKETWKTKILDEGCTTASLQEVWDLSHENKNQT